MLFHLNVIWVTSRVSLVREEQKSLQLDECGGDMELALQHVLWLFWDKKKKKACFYITLMGISYVTLELTNTSNSLAVSN